MLRPRHRAYRGGPGSAGGLAAASFSAAYGAGAVALAAVGVGVVAYAALAQKPRRRPGVTRQQWGKAMAASGAVEGFEALLNEITQRGLEPELRSHVWPFLLGVFSPDSTFEERRAQHAMLVQEHARRLLQCQALEAALRDRVAAAGGGDGAHAAAADGSLPPPPPQQQQQQQPELEAAVVQFAEAHRIIVIDAVRTDFRKHSVAAIHSSGAPAGAAAAAAPPCDNGEPLHGAATLFGPAAGGAAAPLIQSCDAGRWPGSGGGAWVAAPQRLWVSEVAQSVLDSSVHLGDEGRRQAARLIALLSAYAVHDPETGYCQGMSDLAMPLLVLTDDDALAFWCFDALMRTFGSRGNFAVDESGIFGQLRALAGALRRGDRVLSHRLTALGAADCHFAYRMVVVLMRRDLPLAQVMTLWEILWADARRELLARSRRRVLAAGRGGGGSEDGEEQWHDGGDGGGGDDDDDDPKAALRRAQAASAVARLSAAGGDGSGLLAARFTDLFVHFVAAVAISQRRRVLDECAGPDDAMRLFHTLRGIDFWDCVTRAFVLRAAGATRKAR